jgi:hypothetical protein
VHHFRNTPTIKQYVDNEAEPNTSEKWAIISRLGSMIRVKRWSFDGALDSKSFPLTTFGG